jgi:hypothetical protein
LVNPSKHCILMVFARNCQEIHREELGLNCSVCEISDDEKSLRKCAICFKYFCEDCGVDRSGRWFCTSSCADYFFYGDEDDMD